MILQEKLNKKREFKTGSGKKFNISFIPALATQIYQDYQTGSMLLGPELIKHQSILNNPVKKKELIDNVELLEAFNKTYGELKEKTEKVNGLGIEIIMVVLQLNKQSFKVTEKAIYKMMTIDDMNRFIHDVCTPTRDLKKKSKRLYRFGNQI